MKKIYMVENDTFGACFESREDAKAFAGSTGAASGLVISEIDVMPASDRDATREALADLCHRQWSGWMEYLFSKCNFTMSFTLTALEDGSVILPQDLAKRWARQLETDYEHLSESEKDSDRRQADKFMTLLNI